MIYCFKFEDVESYLRSLGWSYVNKGEMHALYEREEKYITFPLPNVFGKIPETVVNQALDDLRIPVPIFDPSWCD